GLRADDESSAEERVLLGEWLEHDVARLGIEAAILGVAHDANHSAPLVTDIDEAEHVARPRDALPDRIFAWEEFLGGGGIQNDDGLRIRLIGRREITAFQQWNSAGAEVIRIRRAPFGVGLSFARRELAVFNFHIELELRRAERHRRADANF